MSRPRRQPWWATLPSVLALAIGLPVVLASCSSGSGGGGSGSGSADAQLKNAGKTVTKQITTYQQTVQQCQSQESPVVCVEAADRTLGGQVHTYANLLATGKDFSAPAHLLSTARYNAQILGNSLEILGDAQPTQANYDQVRNTYDVNGAVNQLRSAVASLDRALTS